MSIKNVSAILQGTSLTVIIDGTDYLVTKDSHRNYDDIMKAYADGDYDHMAHLVDVSKSLNDFANGKISVEEGVVKYKGRPIHNSLTERLLDMMGQDFNVDAMVSFLKNLMKNPSKGAVQDLYRFLEHNSLPITNDGHFLAYKKVRGDFTDIYTGKYDNSVGNVLSMPRYEVEDDRNKTCSSGLHFCSKEYLSHFGARSIGEGGDSHIMILKINPKNVVSIPTDYNNAKGRCCEYEVIGEYVTADTKKEAFDTVVVDTTNKVSDDADDGTDTE